MGIREKPNFERPEWRAYSGTGNCYVSNGRVNTREPNICFQQVEFFGHVGVHGARQMRCTPPHGSFNAKLCCGDVLRGLLDQ